MENLDDKNLVENLDFDLELQDLLDESLFEDLDDLEGTDFSDNLDEEEQFQDTSDKILKLNDQLSEDIIIKNIEEQMTGDVSPIDAKINYLTAFKEKYSSISSTDFLYDAQAMKDSLERITTLVAGWLSKNYGVELGEGLDYQAPNDYLEKMETLYEFLYIRNYQNLVDYFFNQIITMDTLEEDRLISMLNEPEASQDIFVVQNKKKFKNDKDIAILHFMSDLIEDIRDSTDSAYSLFERITQIDMFEEVNFKMSSLLTNYGNDIVLNEDAHSAQLYMKILDNQEVFNALKNDLTLKYLETCELL